MQEIEISQLDLRYEGCRIKNPRQEGRLLASIAQRGIEQPVEGVETSDVKILLNGFKRLRCARKLKISIIPYISIETDEVAGIARLLGTSMDKSLGLLEQAIFVDELKNLHGMNATEIAELLSRSKSWVSMRLGLIGTMSEKVRDKLFAGLFPVYSYMYCLRRFMRMNFATKAEIEAFVSALSNKKLSLREIEQLAQSCFMGSQSLRKEILNGHITLPLQRLKPTSDHFAGCSKFEQAMLKELESIQKYMCSVMGKRGNTQLKSQAFKAQAHILTEEILGKSKEFIKTLGTLHDCTRKA